MTLKPIRTICFCTFLAWMSSGANRAMSSSEIDADWSRDLAATTPNKYRSSYGRFHASMTASTGSLLHVLCRYRLAVGARTASLRGSYDANKDFWPAVSLAVSNERTGTWMTIGIFDPTVEADALTLDRQNPETRLWVAAERFRSFVGTHRWGRIALISDNQAETVIALEDLLPPRSRRHEGGDFKDVLADRGKLQFGSVAFLHSVISIKGQLTGEFVYIGKGRRAAITGVRGPTGDFWPAAKLEVGNLEGPWVKVGENELNSGFRPDRSRHPGSGERFRVDLGGYKSNMGQAQFGKVTFSDSSFAIFLLQDINPDNTDDNLSD